MIAGVKALSNRALSVPMMHPVSHQTLVSPCVASGGNFGADMRFRRMTGAQTLGIESNNSSDNDGETAVYEVQTE